MMRINILAILEDSVCDGEGLRSTVFVSGCFHNCSGCFNKESWDKNKGTSVDLDKLVNKLLSFKNHDITISGGDGLCFFYNEVIELCKKIKEKSDKNIWLYTGFTYEELLQDELRSEVLHYIDVLVDGKFEDDKRDFSLSFKGSSNQNIIDVQGSLNKGKIVYYLI